MESQELLTHLGVCSGIFVSGTQPAWLVASRGTVVLHAMASEGPVVGFTPFHNPNCAHVSCSPPYVQICSFSIADICSGRDPVDILTKLATCCTHAWRMP